MVSPRLRSHSCFCNKTERGHWAILVSSRARQGTSALKPHQAGRFPTDRDCTDSPVSFELSVAQPEQRKRWARSQDTGATTDLARGKDGGELTSWRRTGP